MRYALVCALIAVPTTAHGEPRDSVIDCEVERCMKLEDRPPTTARRALAVAAAIVPGVVVRGIGSKLVGEPVTGKRLAIVGAIGFGAMLIGGIPTAIGRGNPYLIVPFVPVLVAGTGVFLSTWASDIYVAAGGGTGQARAPTPWSFEAGSTWLRDPYRNRVLLRGTARAVIGRFDTGLGVLVDAGGDVREGVLETEVRIAGAAETGEVVRDGTRVTVRAALRGRDDRADDVRVGTAELEAILRVDARRVTPQLGGAFAELSTGVGVERVAYTGETDHSALLLGRFAWGMYLGTRGEATLFYDHRRDHLAGGLAAGRAAGFMGSWGANLDLRIAGPWAARAELEVGSSWVTTFALRYQGGAR